MTNCILCGRDVNKVWYTAAIIFGAPDDIDVGPWCDDCKPSTRTPGAKVRYALLKMAEKKKHTNRCPYCGQLMVSQSQIPS